MDTITDVFMDIFRGKLRLKLLCIDQAIGHARAKNFSVPAAVLERRAALAAMVESSNKAQAQSVEPRTCNLTASC